MPDHVYRVSTSGVESARKQLDELNARTGDWKSTADRLAGSFQNVARDIDTVAGESASKFARAANDVIGVTTALGTGGMAGGVALVSTAVSGLLVLWGEWKKETEDQKRIAAEAAGAEKKWLDDTLANVEKVTKSLKAKSFEELQSLLVVRQLQEAHIAEERVSLVAQLVAVRGNAEEQNKVQKELAENTKKMAQSVSDTKKTIVDRDAALERMARSEGNAEEMDLQKIRQDRAKARLAMDDAIADANSDRNIKDADEEKKRIAAETQAQNARDKVGQDALDKRARSFEKEKEEKAKAAAQEEKDGQEALDMLEKLLEATDKLAAEKRQLAEEARKVAIAESLQTGATIAMAGATTVATPIISALMDAEMELAMANRETFRDMTIFSKELPALIAQKTQAILAGIAVEATGRAIMEGGEAAAALGLGLGLAALGLPNAGAAFASAAAHGAAAAMFANIAGISLVGAGAVGSIRGDGGLVGLTKAEKDKNKGGVGSARGSDASRGGGFGGSGQMGPETNNTYYIYNNSIDASDKQQRNRQVMAANKENARDPFAAREMRRAV